MAPEDRTQARHDVATFLNSPSQIFRMIRLSEASRDSMNIDLASASKIRSQPDAVLLPKVESAQQILDVKTSYEGLFGQKPVVVSLIESARGVLSADSISENSDAVMIGEADLASDLRCMPASTRLEHAAAVVLLTANAHGIDSIASPWFDIHDAVGLSSRAAKDSEDGYTGKAAIHPSQIAVIEQAFRPNAESLLWAQRVIQAMENGAIAKVDGLMIDEALARRARRIIALTEQR